MDDLIHKLQLFATQEARSCSIDFGCITPIYIYRMWGGIVPLKEIESALKLLSNDNVYETRND